MNRPTAPIVGSHAINRYRDRFDPSASDGDIFDRLVTPPVTLAMSSGANCAFVAPDIIVCLDGFKITTVFKGTGEDAARRNAATRLKTSNFLVNLPGR